VSNEATSLVTIAQERAGKARERHALLAAELYGAPRGLLTDAERSLLSGMIAGIVSRLASRLDVAMEDGDETTAERLRRAGFLADPDLVGAAYHRMLEAEIERRASGHELLTDLSSGQDLEVVHALTEYRVWRAARFDSYGNPLLGERDMPFPALTNLCWAIAAVRGLVDPAREDVIEAATRGEIAALGEASPSPPEVAARRLIEAGLTDSESLIRLTEAGEIALVEAVIAQLASVPLDFMRRVLFEPGGETLAMLAKTAAMDRTLLTTLIATGRRARPRGAECSAALALFDGLQSETARRAVARLTLSPAYLAAARRLEGAGSL
jgi:hypothetical protein